jgi:hypothetical protein
MAVSSIAGDGDQRPFRSMADGMAMMDLATKYTKLAMTGRVSPWVKALHGGDYGAVMATLRKLEGTELAARLEQRETKMNSSAIFHVILGESAANNKDPMFQLVYRRKVRSEQDHKRILIKLLELGARVNAKDMAGSSPLHLVGNLDSAKVLLEAGADPNQSNRLGQTPLLMQAKDNKADWIKLFLQYGGDPDFNCVMLGGLEQYTSRECAQALGHQQVLAVLEACGPRGSLGHQACGAPGCNKPASLRCPKCKKMDLDGGFFCSKECFEGCWSEHKAVHKARKADKKAEEAAQVQNQLSSLGLGPHWSEGRAEEERAVWLADCYRLRAEEEYVFSGEVRSGCLYDQERTASELAQDFLVFCRLALARAGLPDGWSWPAFLSTAASLLPFAFERCDAREKHGGPEGARQLREVGNTIYGSQVVVYSLGGFGQTSCCRLLLTFAQVHLEEEDQMAQKMYNRTRRSFPEWRRFGRNEAPVEDVGGPAAWRELEEELRRELGRNDAGADQGVARGPMEKAYHEKKEKTKSREKKKPRKKPERTGLVTPMTMFVLNIAIERMNHRLADEITEEIGELPEREVARCVVDRLYLEQMVDMFEQRINKEGD